MAETLPPGIDATRPNVARVYDYLLDGKDNFAADRELAIHLLGIVPGMKESAHDNRSFVCAAAARAAADGITQFLDLGAGLPDAGRIID
jgi:S-adenosyl methyltransferase